jgi:hypothetical protein
MRDRERPLEKPDGVFRVMVLGDSFMEALQLPLDAALPHLLEQDLNTRSGKQIEIINASVSGWGTDDELKYLSSYGFRWKPDLVIIAVTLYNDISDNLRQRFHTVTDGALVARPPTNAPYLDYTITQLKGFLATRFHTYQLLIRARRAREVRAEASQLQAHFVGLFRSSYDERMSRGVDLTGLLLERTRAVASSSGGRVAVVLIPLAVQLSDAAFAEFARAAEESPLSLEINKPQRVIKEAADRSGIPVIDLLPAFREWAASGGESLYLTRDGHWNQAGHRLAATVVGSELRRLGLVPAR